MERSKAMEQEKRMSRRNKNSIYSAAIKTIVVIGDVTKSIETGVAAKTTRSSSSSITRTRRQRKLATSKMKENRPETEATGVEVIVVETNDVGVEMNDVGVIEVVAGLTKSVVKGVSKRLVQEASDPKQLSRRITSSNDRKRQAAAKLWFTRK